MTEPVNINAVPKLNLGLQETDEVFISRGGSGPYRVPASSFPWEQKGDKGDPGGSWAPVLSLVTDGVRRVHRIVGWVGGTGVEPTTTGYIGSAGIVSNVAEAVDVRGLQGNAGWAPVLALVADGDRRVHQVIDWTGGAGAKPGVGWYVGVTGLVELIQDAVNVRGATGGVGWSPVLAITTDGERRVQRVIDWAGGFGTKPTLAGYVGTAGIVATAAEAVDVRGAPGSASWAPVLAIVADGERLVQRVVDWTGGVGAKPTLVGYVGPAGLVETAAAAVNVRGAQGSAGWSPVLAIEVDGERRVHKIVGWTGGAGANPIVAGYIGSGGVVMTVGEAVDVRGSGVVSGENIQTALTASPPPVISAIASILSAGRLVIAASGSISAPVAVLTGVVSGSFSLPSKLIPAGFLVAGKSSISGTVLVRRVGSGGTALLSLTIGPADNSSDASMFSTTMAAVTNNDLRANPECFIQGPDRISTPSWLAPGVSGVSAAIDRATGFNSYSPQSIGIRISSANINDQFILIAYRFVIETAV